MSKAMKKSPTGCRPAQLFGVWLIEPARFAEYHKLAMSVDLVALGESRRAEKLKSLSEDDDDELADDSGTTSDAEPVQYKVVNGIAYFDLSGPMTKYESSFQSIMGGTATLPLKRGIRLAASDPLVLGAIIFVDSPGGTVDGTQALADEVAEFAAAKPIIAMVDGYCCSAAEWVASQCTATWATPTSLVGSIGTRMSVYDTSKMYEQEGVKVHEITSDGADLKVAGADGTPVTDAHIEYFKGIANDSQKFFTDAVKSGRNLTDAQMNDLLDGRVMIAGRGKDAGLVDNIGDEDDAMKSLYDAIFFRSQMRA